MINYILFIFTFFITSCGKPANEPQWNSSQNKFVSGEHFFQFFLENKNPYVRERKEDISQIKTAVLCLKGDKKNLSVFMAKSSQCCSCSREEISMTYSDLVSKNHVGYACYEGSINKKMLQSKVYSFDFTISPDIFFERIEI